MRACARGTGVAPLTASTPWQAPGPPACPEGVGSHRVRVCAREEAVGWPAAPANRLAPSIPRAYACGRPGALRCRRPCRRKLGGAFELGTTRGAVPRAPPGRHRRASLARAEASARLASSDEHERSRGAWCSCASTRQRGGATRAPARAATRTRRRRPSLLTRCLIRNVAKQVLRENATRARGRAHRDVCSSPRGPSLSA